MQKTLDPQKLKDLVSFKPTLKQQHILENLTRFNTIIGGKRVGKTMLVAYIALKELLSSGRVIWVVAPQYQLSQRIWDYVYNWATLHFPTALKTNKTDKTIENIATGSLLELKTADNPISLKGKGLSLLIIDEANDVDEKIWNNFLRPNITESRPELDFAKGRAIIIGNAPVLGHWFDRIFRSDMDDKFAYHLPTALEKNGELVASNNPEIVSVEELRIIKASSPQRVWQTEYLAATISGEGQVFKNIRENIKTTLKPAEWGRRYYIGVDLGRRQDYTVIAVMDAKTYELVYFDRFSKLDWIFQKEKIRSVYERFNKGLLTIDATGLGDTITNDLERAGINVNPIQFTNESKKDLIEKLSVFIEKGDIKYPDIPELLSELESYEYEYSKTGKVVYNAPSGLHDDCVIALALACWELQIKPTFTPLRNLQDDFKEVNQSVGLFSKLTWAEKERQKAENKFRVDSYE